MEQRNAELEELKEYLSVQHFTDSDDDERDAVSEGGSDLQSDDRSEGSSEGGSDGEGKMGEKEILKQRNAELEELQKEYLSIRHTEQDILKNLKRHKEEDALKGQAVKNQKALWDKTLELRFLLQKAFSSSNKLPLEPVMSSFCNSDRAVDQAYSDFLSSSKHTLNSFLELHEALLDNNPSIAQETDGNNTKSSMPEDLSNDSKEGDHEDWLQIHRMHCRIAPFRNNSVDKWQRKTQVTTGAAAVKSKLQAFNQNISEQVAGYMRDSSRMVRRMQLKRSYVPIFGTVPEDFNSKASEDVDGAQEYKMDDGDPELLDDSEFYQQLLKEFFESCDFAPSESGFYAMKKLLPKKRKIVDRRASKSRKIRYNVHEKIVNFMAPIPMVLPLGYPELLSSLFRSGSQRSNSAL